MHYQAEGAPSEWGWRKSLSREWPINKALWNTEGQTSILWAHSHREFLEKEHLASTYWEIYLCSNFCIILSKQNPITAQQEKFHAYLYTDAVLSQEIGLFPACPFFPVIFSDSRNVQKKKGEG